MTSSGLNPPTAIILLVGFRETLAKRTVTGAAYLTCSSSMALCASGPGGLITWEDQERRS